MLSEKKRVQLFGGAMSISIPKTLIDASDFRQIPDNQEVWISQETSDDSCIIIELVEYDDPSHDISYHFHQLSIDNEATNVSIIRKDHSLSSQVPDSFPKVITSCETLVGTQSISKFRSSDNSKDICIYFATLNIPIYKTTILISYHQESPFSSDTYDSFLHCIFSLELHDPSLFFV